MAIKLKSTSVIKTRLGINPNGKVQKFFQNTCYEYMDKYVPKREGHLRQEVDLSKPKYIIYEMPYARYQYYGIREDGTQVVTHYTTPGTGPYWDKRMASAEMGKVVDRVQEYINRGGK